MNCIKSISMEETTPGITGSISYLTIPSVNKIKYTFDTKYTSKVGSWTYKLTIKTKIETS
jgi:hypothetical protein